MPILCALASNEFIDNYGMSSILFFLRPCQVRRAFEGKKNNSIAMPVTVEAPMRDLPPLLDERAMEDWCSDIGTDDILAILASVPDECQRNVAEIERAIAAGNLTASKKAAHRLKGMAGNLGAARLAMLARDIELNSGSIADVAGQMQGLREAVKGTLAALDQAALSRQA